MFLFSVTHSNISEHIKDLGEQLFRNESTHFEEALKDYLRVLGAVRVLFFPLYLLFIYYLFIIYLLFIYYFFIISLLLFIIIYYYYLLLFIY
jgi:hypothetical protein